MNPEDADMQAEGDEVLVPADDDAQGQQSRRGITNERSRVEPIDSRLDSTGEASARKAEFPPLLDAATGVPEENLERIVDIPLQLTVELGRAEMTIADVLRLGPGTVITLDKMAGDPVEIVIKGQAFAYGEVVVIEDNFCVRITSIISRQERLSRVT